MTGVMAEAEFTQIVKPLEPLVYSIAETADDQVTRQRAARFIGSVATSHNVTIESAETVQPIESLYDAIKLAAAGNEQARLMVKTNVHTDVIERTIKAGHVTKVDLMVDEAGEILQHGQYMESVQANSLRYMANNWKMRERTEAEATNAFRIKQLYQAGKLEDYSFVVLSRAADNMSLTEMEDSNFFADTMSCAIQVTTARDGRLTTESAFVAGVTAPGSQRHDEAAVIHIGDQLGVDLKAKSAAQIINTPILVHNSLLPNGAVDLVELYDDANSTFFGQAKPRQDYQLFQAICAEREMSFAPKVNKIVIDILAAASQLQNRVHAAQLLNKISGRHMVEQAVFDTTINPQVFGPAAAVQIEQARHYAQQGDALRAATAITQAKKTETSSSCPGALKNLFDGSDHESSESDQEPIEDCEFESKECPKCHKKNVWTVVRKGVYHGDCGCKS